MMALDRFWVLTANHRGDGPMSPSKSSDRSGRESIPGPLNTLLQFSREGEFDNQLSFPYLNWLNTSIAFYLVKLDFNAQVFLLPEGGMQEALQIRCQPHTCRIGWLFLQLSTRNVFCEKDIHHD
jgi:hypothetical protein